MVSLKRRLSNKPVGVKCKALKDLGKGMTNKDVVAKYGVPKKTLSTWVKNKQNLTISLEKKECLLHGKAHTVGATTK